MTANLAFYRTTYTRRLARPTSTESVSSERRIGRNCVSASTIRSGRFCAFCVPIFYILKTFFRPNCYCAISASRSCCSSSVVRAIPSRYSFSICFGDFLCIKITQKNFHRTRFKPSLKTFRSAYSSASSGRSRSPLERAGSERSLSLRFSARFCYLTSRCCTGNYTRCCTRVWGYTYSTSCRCFSSSVRRSSACS